MSTTPHHHPEYEETFARVATILDVMAQEQLALQQGQAALQRGHADLQAAMQRGHAELQQAHAETERALAEYIEHAKLRDAETTDKLNGLIELMDRHLRERGSH